MEQDQVASTSTSRTDLVSVGTELASFASAQRDASSVTIRTSKPAVVATPAICSCGPDRVRKQGHYTVGYEYPGSVIGHRYCNPCNIGLLYPVPRNMGWLWNSMDVSGIKPRRGYTPGYIGKNTSTGSSAVVKLPHSFDKALAMKKRQKQQQIYKVEVSTLLSDTMSTGTPYTIKMSHVDKKRENFIGEILHIPPADQNTSLGSDAVYEAFQGIQDAEFMQYIENKKQKLKIALKRERRSVFEETIQDICKFVYDDMFPTSQDKSCTAKDRIILSEMNKTQSNDFTIKKLITEKQNKRFNSMLSSKHKPMNETFKKVNPLRESSKRPIYPKTTNPSTQIAVKRDYIVERKPIVNQSMNKTVLNTKHKQTPQSKMIQFHKQKSLSFADSKKSFPEKQYFDGKKKRKANELYKNEDGLNGTGDKMKSQSRLVTAIKAESSNRKRISSRKSFTSKQNYSAKMVQSKPVVTDLTKHVKVKSDESLLLFHYAILEYPHILNIIEVALKGNNAEENSIETTHTLPKCIINTSIVPPIMSMHA